MVKTHTTITMDIETLTQAKRLGINMSKALEDTLNAMIGSYSNDDQKTYIEYVNELEELKANKKELSIKESILLSKIEGLKLKKQKVDEERLKQKIAMSKAIVNSGLHEALLD